MPRQKLPDTLPSGLEAHCEGCAIVVPSDAPRLAVFDCEFVATNKMSWFNPQETLRRQHTMATAAWQLIHRPAFDKPPLDAAAAAYWHLFMTNAKQHFRQSAAYKALSPEDIKHQLSLIDPVRDKGRFDINFYSSSSPK